MTTKKKTLKTRIYSALVLELMKNYIHNDDLGPDSLEDITYKFANIAALRVKLSEVFEDMEELRALLQDNPKLDDKLSEFNPVHDEVSYIYEVIWYHVDEIIRGSRSYSLLHSNSMSPKEFYRELYTELTDIYLRL